MCGKPCAQSEKTATSPNCKQSSAAQRGRDACGTATRIMRIAVPQALCVLREHLRPRLKSGKVCRSDTRPGDVRERAARVEGNDSAPVRKARVSPCKPLCAILFRKPSVYPLSLVKANVGRLCEKLKNAMKSGLGQHCDGNFLKIYAGTILSEKLNFLSRIFRR